MGLYRFAGAGEGAKPFVSLLFGSKSDSAGKKASSSRSGTEPFVDGFPLDFGTFSYKLCWDLSVSFLRIGSSKVIAGGWKVVYTFGLSPLSVPFGFSRSINGICSY